MDLLEHRGNNGKVEEDSIRVKVEREDQPAKRAGIHAGAGLP
jgi:hypothetical protein